MTDADSKLPLAGIALIAATVFGFAATAVAQEIPEGQSCGGLVCDLGLFGHKTAPKAAPAVPVPAAATPVPPPARTAVTSETEEKRPSHKKVSVAKAPAAKPPKTAAAKTAAAKTAAAKAAKVSPVAALGAPPVTSSLVPAAPAAARAPAPVTAAPPPAVAVAPPTAIPVTATPNEPVVLSNPYVYNKPLKFMFQSVDPTQGVQ